MEPNTCTAYVKSPFLQVVREGNSAVVWHSLFGYPKIVSLETLEFLARFNSPATIESQLDEGTTEDELAAIEELQRCYFLVPDNLDERVILEKRIQNLKRDITTGSLINYLGLIVSEACNFRCSYCIHFHNLETSVRGNNPSKFMRFDIAKTAIDKYLAVLREHGKRIAEINFGGGEPLLNWATIQQVLHYCRDQYGSEFEFRFSLNTNASLITPEIANILKTHHIEVASSLDGLREGNDRVRLTKCGGGTFSQIVHGFRLLAGAGYPLDGIAVTVTEANFHQLDESIIDWAIANGMNNVRIDIDVINIVEIPVETIVEKLMRVRQYASQHGVDVPGFWSRPVENLNESILGSRGSFCGAVRGNSLCINPSGEIYGCGYSTTRLGNLSTFQQFYAPDSPYDHLVKSRLIGEMGMCRGCMIEGQCGGGCHITQEYAAAINTAKIDRMCDFYRRMTQEVLREQLKQATVRN